MKTVTADELRKCHMRTTIFMDGTHEMKHQQVRMCVEHPMLGNSWIQSNADVRAGKPGSTVWFVGETDLEGDPHTAGFFERAAELLNACYATAHGEESNEQTAKEADPGDRTAAGRSEPDR